MKAPLTAFAALIALGLAAPAFAQNSATPATPATPANPAVTAPATKAEHGKKADADKTRSKSTAQAPKKDNEHSNKGGAVRGQDRAADVKTNNDVKK